MDNKTTLLNILDTSGDFVSGSELAERMGVTRAAVWKYIKALKDEGYDIEAVTNRGYRLSPSSDVITADGITNGLGDLAGVFRIEVLQSCSSTNLVLRERAAALKEWHTVVAGSQTAGRGRLGRSFWSPDGTGLYMSVFLRPNLPAAETTFITTAAAVAVCRAIEELAGIKAGIKWVNDIFVNGKKVCGILTEASLDMESGTVGHAVLGIGINVTEPEGGFPEELKEIAGAVFPYRQKNMRSRLAATVLRQFYSIYTNFPNRDFVKEYQALSFLVGKEVSVLRGGNAEPATVLRVDDLCRLAVRYPDGREETLSGGEVSVRPGEIKNEAESVTCVAFGNSRGMGTTKDLPDPQICSRRQRFDLCGSTEDQE